MVVGVPQPKLRTIHLWLDKWSEANLGIATGGPTNLVVIDIDPRHGGDRSLSDLERQHGRLPRTYTVKTGSGGSHLYLSTEGIISRSVTPQAYWVRESM